MRSKLLSAAVEQTPAQSECLGMLEAVGEVFPEAKYQRCTVHFYRNVFAVTPRSKAKLVAKMLKAIARIALFSFQGPICTKIN